MEIFAYTLPFKALKAQEIAKKPIPATENPIVYSVYFNTPKSTRAAPIRKSINEAHPKMVFLFIPILLCSILLQIEPANIVLFYLIKYFYQHLFQ